MHKCWKYALKPSLVAEKESEKIVAQPAFHL